MNYLTYRGIDFDEFVKDNNGYCWAEICEECAKKYRDLIGEDIDDGGTAQGYCSVMGCLNRGIREDKKHYYIDFKPQFITKGIYNND